MEKEEEERVGVRRRKRELEEQRGYEERVREENGAGARGCGGKIENKRGKEERERGLVRTDDGGRVAVHGHPPVLQGGARAHRPV
jgi:hypothetical protein